MTPETIVIAESIALGVTGVVIPIEIWVAMKALGIAESWRARFRDSQSMSLDRLSALNVAIQACADKDATIERLYKKGESQRATIQWQDKQSVKLRAELATHEQRKARRIAQCKANASAGGRAAAAKRRELKGENHA